MLAICCLSGCGQSDFRQSDSMPDLQLKIQNELDNVLGITILYAFRGPFWGPEDKSIRPPATPSKKSLIYKGFSAPKCVER